MLLHSFPVGLVTKVQVFDKKSELAAFTGFDDGKDKKTINIVTRKTSGTIAKAYAGAGSKDHYTAGASLNAYRKKETVSFAGMANNTGQRFGDDIRNTSPVAKVFTQNGNLNYSNELSKRLQVSGSYDFIRSGQDNQTELSREYFGVDMLRTWYREQSSAKYINQAHRASLRAEYKPSKSNTIIFEPRFIGTGSAQQGNIRGCDRDGGTINSKDPTFPYRSQSEPEYRQRSALAASLFQTEKISFD